MTIYVMIEYVFIKIIIYNKQTYNFVSIYIIITDFINKLPLIKHFFLVAFTNFIE